MLSDDDDDNDDVLNSSMNSTTSKHRKVSPNKISPRVNLENMPEGGTFCNRQLSQCDLMDLSKANSRRIVHAC
jgi:hypothetical protein